MKPEQRKPECEQSSSKKRQKISSVAHHRKHYGLHEQVKCAQSVIKAVDSAFPKVFPCKAKNTLKTLKLLSGFLFQMFAVIPLMLPYFRKLLSILSGNGETFSKIAAENA